MGHLQSSAGTGHLLYGPNGHLVYLCTRPCTDCDGAQPSCLITIAGTCADYCQQAAATYGYIGFSDGEDYCKWEWLNQFELSGGLQDGDLYTSQLNLIYCLATGVFGAVLAGQAQEPDHTPFCAYNPGADVICLPAIQGQYTDVSEYVTCDKGTGLLQGTFELAGSLIASEDCIATITLDP